MQMRRLRWGSWGCFYFHPIPYPLRGQLGNPNLCSRSARAGEASVTNEQDWIHQGETSPER